MSPSEPYAFRADLLGCAQRFVRLWRSRSTVVGEPHLLGGLLQLETVEDRRTEATDREDLKSGVCVCARARARMPVSVCDCVRERTRASVCEGVRACGVCVLWERRVAGAHHAMPWGT